MAPPIKNLTGQRFGRWTAISFAGGTYGNIAWNCLCDCGTKRAVLRRSLANGVSQSCGCARDEYYVKLKTHGLSESREYKIWQAMLQRCENPNHRFFYRYGGRGIVVCKKWHSFTKFFADIGKSPTRQHTLDRIDNDGNYEPGNVRWATKKQQCRNTRTVRKLTLKGKTMTAVEWAEQLGVAVPTIYSRLRKGWPIHRVLSPEIDERRSYASKKRRRKT